MLKAFHVSVVHHEKELIIIAKRSSRPLNPIQWNVFAILFILGLMPFAVAFISNAGSSSDEAWVDSMQLHDVNQNFQALNDDSIWLENGGLNLTTWYETYYPPQLQNGWLDTFALDCAYITKGECEGYFNNTQYLHDPLLYMGVSDDDGFYSPRSYYKANDYYINTRSSELSQSHRPTGTPPPRHGTDNYSWYFSSLFNNEITQGETLDSIRYLFVSADTYSCESELNYLFANITFEGEISFIYDNETTTYSNFEFEKFTKFQYRVLDHSTGATFSTCAVGFYVEFDLTGFESLELHTKNGGGDWDNTSTIISLTNFVNLDNPNDFGTTKLPFVGDGVFYLGVEHREINPVEAGFLIKTGTLILGIITLVFAIASTTYWNPFTDFFKGGIF